MKNTKNIKFYRDTRIKGIEASRVKSSCHVFPKHAHDDIFAFCLMTRGTCFCLDEKKSDLTLARGQIALINPAQVHSGIPVGNQAISYWMLYVDINAMVSFASDIFEQRGILPEFNKMIIDSPLTTKDIIDLRSRIVY